MDKPIKDFLDPTLMRTVWGDYVQIADKYYQPGKFTTFVSYEWTSAAGRRRTCIATYFSATASSIPAVPFTALDSVHPEDLWAWMDGQRKQATSCLRSRTTATSATA